MGIEPTPSAWKAEVLPLNYTRLTLDSVIIRNTTPSIFLVEGVGFEPTKALPADLQSAPVDHLGTPPKNVSRPFSFNHADLSILTLCFYIRIRAKFSEDYSLTHTCHQNCLRVRLLITTNNVLFTR